MGGGTAETFFRGATKLLGLISFCWQSFQIVRLSYASQLLFLPTRRKSGGFESGNAAHNTPISPLFGPGHCSSE
jgi:hypothetical protein